LSHRSASNQPPHQPNPFQALAPQQQTQANNDGARRLTSPPYTTSSQKNFHPLPQVQNNNIPPTTYDNLYSNNYPNNYSVQKPNPEISDSVNNPGVNSTSKPNLPYYNNLPSNRNELNPNAPQDRSNPHLVSFSKAPQPLNQFTSNDNNN